MSKDQINQELSKVINSYTIDLLNGLSNAKILTKVLGTNDTFIVTRKVKRDYSIRVGSDLNFLSTVMAFRQIVLSVYGNIFDDHKTTSDQLSNLITQLSADGLFKSTWTKDKSLVDFFDKISLIQKDPQIKSAAQKAFEDNNINLTLAANELLQAYGIRKAREYFGSFNYLTNFNTSNEADLVLMNREYYFKRIIFEFKIRRGNNPLDDTTILLALRKFEEFENSFEEMNSASAMILTIFVDEPFNDLPKLYYKFNNIVNSIDAFDNIKSRLILNAVSLDSLHLITKGFEEFKNEFVEGTFEAIFESKRPPNDLPFRNDFLHERVIDIRKYNVDITVSPGQLNGWRFGFRFSEEQEIGFVFGDRHADSNYYDIHVAAGNVTTANGKAEWTDPNIFELVQYHIQLLEDTFKGDQNYQKQPVMIMLRYGHDDDKLYVLVYIGNNDNGMRIYALDKHYFFKMFAWADGIDFSLKVKVKTERFMH